MSKLKKIIREAIKETIEEVSTSAAAGAYNTPHAFVGKSKKNKQFHLKNAEHAGYKLVRKKLNF